MKKITVYDQLMRLNIIPNAYEEWSDYRKTLTDFIINHTKVKRSALIVGAGRCNDFDLKRLSDHFSSLTLADIDSEAICQGLKKQEISSERAYVRRADIVGLGADKLRALSEEVEILARKGKNDLTDVFLNRCESLFNERIPDPLYTTGQFDYVICIGVHSQLLSIIPRIACVFQRAGFMNIETVCKYVSSMNTQLIPEINSKLIRISKDGILFGLEKQRIGMSGAIEGAKQAFVDLEANPYIDVIDSLETVWPFNLSSRHLYRITLLYTEKSHPFN